MSEPQVTDQACHSSYGSNTPVTRIVIHDTESGGGFPAASQAPTAHGVANYFTQQSSGGSAHYIVDTATEMHVLPDSTIGWHAPPNQGSIGIEICGQAAYSRDQWLSPEVWPAVQRAAARTVELCHRFGVPLRKINSGDLVNGAHGICGHYDVSQAWHQSDHSDPGPNFPWDRFMQEVGGSAGPVAQAPSATPNKGYVVKGVQSAPSNPGFTAYLQRRLGIPADGSWGPQTNGALAQFQRDHGLTPDSVIGPATAAALGWSFRA